MRRRYKFATGRRDALRCYYRLKGGKSAVDTKGSMRRMHCNAFIFYSAAVYYILYFIVAMSFLSRS
jgi:hypothetical protein